MNISPKVKELMLNSSEDMLKINSLELNIDELKLNLVQLKQLNNPLNKINEHKESIDLLITDVNDLKKESNQSLSTIKELEKKDN